MHSWFLNVIHCSQWPKKIKCHWSLYFLHRNVLILNFLTSQNYKKYIFAIPGPVKQDGYAGGHCVSESRYGHRTVEKSFKHSWPTRWVFIHCKVSHISKHQTWVVNFSIAFGKKINHLISCRESWSITPCPFVTLFHFSTKLRLSLGPFQERYFYQGPHM